MPGNRVWKLSVEGVIKQVTHATLTKVKHSDLAKLFQDPDKVDIEKDGSVFIDRDVSSFMIMINYLRNDCKISVTLDELHKKNLTEELDYWKASPYYHPIFLMLE